MVSSAQAAKVTEAVEVVAIARRLMSRCRERSLIKSARVEEPEAVQLQLVRLLPGSEAPHTRHRYAVPLAV
jgi:hypothetical protein